LWSPETGAVNAGALSNALARRRIRESQQLRSEMSRYEWEQGSFTIPSAEWARVKKDIRDKMNAEIESSFALAEQVYKHVSEIRPKLKGEAMAKAADDFLARQYPRVSDSKHVMITSPMFPNGMSRYGTGPEITMIRPTKKMYPIHKSNAEYIRDDECSIKFDNENRKLEWYVSENNHACERAREGSLGTAVFGTLRTVKWTRGTGGTVIGNDEYNRDRGSDYVGGGATYAKDSFGPEKAKPTKSLSSFHSESLLRFRR
jgi:hypothetical protein